MGSCDRGSAVVGFLFMVLVCGGRLCNDGGEATVVVSTSRFVGCGGFFFGCDLSSDLWVVDLWCVVLWWLGVLPSKSIHSSGAKNIAI